jgi:putative FmdB family regulatory protein
MPIYEYRCTSCGHTLEVIQKLSDAPITKCTECSGPLEKLVSRTAFLLKGGGWFNEGYGGSKSGGGKDGAGSTGDGASGGETPPPKKAAAGGCGSGSCGCH